MVGVDGPPPRDGNDKSPRVGEDGANAKSKMMAQLHYHYSQKDGLVPEPPLTLLKSIYKVVSG